jgi:hypothetical protein
MQMNDIQDPEDLHRLAIFILAHTMIDFLLTGTVIGHELSGPSEQEIQERLVKTLVGQIQNRTFANRLDHAKRDRLVSGASFRIAKALNDTRNDFIHRHQMPPVYKGKKITKDDGLYEALNDAVGIIKGLVIHAKKMGWKTPAPERSS